MARPSGIPIEVTFCPRGTKRNGIRAVCRTDRRPASNHRHVEILGFDMRVRVGGRRVNAMDYGVADGNQPL